MTCSSTEQYDDRKYVDTIRMLEFDDSADGIMLQPLCNGKIIHHEYHPKTVRQFV